MRTIEHPLSKKKIPEYATGVITPVFTPSLEGGRLEMHDRRELEKSTPPE